jgi:hypothetical protein
VPDLPPGPLAGVRVVDCSTVLAGPYATMLLADLGADVVKVEPPEGDATRGWGPPWVGDDADGIRTAAYYLAVNRNKRSLRLDLRQPAGAAVLRRLLADADVFVENLRPDSLARLGFDGEALGAINPRLVHLAISGYGPTGPLVGRAGYDFLLQAETEAVEWRAHGHVVTHLWHVDRLHANPEGHLFGSVSKRDIADELQKLGHNVQPDDVKLDDPIRRIDTWKYIGPPSDFAQVKNIVDKRGRIIAAR